MGPHFLDRIDFNGVTFSVESVEWACTFIGLLGLENSGVTIRFMFLIIRVLDFWSSVCKISHPLSTVGRYGLLMKYRHSFATFILLNHFVHHEITQLHCNKPRSNHRALTVKSRQIQCKHSYLTMV